MPLCTRPHAQQPETGHSEPTGPRGGPDQRSRARPRPQVGDCCTLWCIACRMKQFTMIQDRAGTTRPLNNSTKQGVHTKLAG